MEHVSTLDAGMVKVLTEPKKLHRYAMERLPQQGLGESPRAAAGFQYRVDVPGDVLGRDGVVVLTWRSKEVDRVEVVEGQQLQVMVRVAAFSRRDGVVVPWVDAQAWEKTQDLLLRHGFELVEDEDGTVPMVVGPRMRGAACPVRDVLARVVVFDVDLAQQALDNGIGRCKNYGAGMLVVVD